MIELGFRESRLVPCVNSMWDESADGEPAFKALVSLHVDDGLVAGNDAALPVWKELQSRLRLSAWNEVTTDGTEFSGCMLLQEADFSVTIDIDAYLQSVQCMTILQNRDDSDVLDETEFAQLWKLVGCLGYAPTNGRHDIAFGTS